MHGVSESNRPKPNTTSSAQAIELPANKLPAKLLLSKVLDTAVVETLGSIRTAVSAAATSFNSAVLLLGLISTTGLSCSDGCATPCADEPAEDAPFEPAVDCFFVVSADLASVEAAVAFGGVTPTPEPVIGVMRKTT